MDEKMKTIKQLAEQYLQDTGDFCVEHADSCVTAAYLAGWAARGERDAKVADAVEAQWDKNTAAGNPVTAYWAAQIAERIRGDASDDSRLNENRIIQPQSQTDSIQSAPAQDERATRNREEVAKMEMDMAIYGKGYLKSTPEGGLERIDPFSVQKDAQDECGVAGPGCDLDAASRKTILESIAEVKARTQNGCALKPCTKWFKCDNHAGGSQHVNAASAQQEHARTHTTAELLMRDCPTCAKDEK